MPNSSSGWRLLNTEIHAYVSSETALRVASRSH